MAKITIVVKDADAYRYSGNDCGSGKYYQTKDEDIYFATDYGLICLTDPRKSYSNNKHACEIKMRLLSNCTISIEV